jgi:hypothetical protein
MVKRTTTKKKGLPNCLMDIAYGLSSKNAASEELTPNVGCLLKRLVSSSFVHCLSTAFNACGCIVVRQLSIVSFPAALM